MLLTDYFQRIYVINLPERQDRREEMAQQLDKIGLSFSSPAIQLFEAVRPEGPGSFPSIGARGAFLSHLRILRQASEQGLQSILIFEDDLNFAPDFPARIDPVLKELQKDDWSIFYGGHLIEGQTDKPEIGPLVLAVPSAPIQTAHFVGFRGSAIRQITDYLEAILTRPAGDPAGGPMHVDGAYSWFRRAYPQHLTLVATPELGYQRSSKSDIHTLRWFDRNPMTRGLVGWLRRSRNKSRP